MSAPAQPVQGLNTITTDTLQQTDLPPLRYVVEGLLPEGLTVLVAPPKSGKSWLALWLCLATASGRPFLGRQTNPCAVLYLALEDGLRRLQQRQARLLQGETAPSTCHIAIAANGLDEGLLEQLDAFIQAHPLTGLIVIDVLARIRPRQTPARNANAYEVDYGFIGRLKAFADERHIALLIIHHTRKASDATDVYNSISGSNGISGAADTLLALRKERRADRTATLHVIGRDVEPQELIVEMNPDNCRWMLVGTAGEIQAQRTRQRFEAAPIVRAVLELLEENPGGVKLTAEELRAETIRRVGYLGEQDNAPKIGRFLADYADSFAEIGIDYTTERQRDKRLQCFKRRAAE